MSEGVVCQWVRIFKSERNKEEKVPQWGKEWLSVVSDQLKIDEKVHENRRFPISEQYPQISLTV